MAEQETDVYVVWDEVLGRYDFGAGHPMNPLRLDLTARLCRDLGLFGIPGVVVRGAEAAGEELLSTVHSEEYIRAVRTAGSAAGAPDGAGRDLPADFVRRFGLGTDDVPVFPNMHEASARLVQGSVQAADEVLAGRFRHAVNFCGGMHHAGRGHASGFCVYNDAAAAIRRLLDGGVRRVVYLDLDAHHGDGVESIFWDEPRVLTISLHETGRTLFPGTGFADETGGASGSAANVALPPRSGDAEWLRAFDAVVPPLVRAFEPEVVVSQHGCDGHLNDPLTHLRLSVDAMREAALMVARLVERHAQGRWIALGGGGYEIVQVVPRAWAHLLAIAIGRPIPVDEPVPASWRDYVAARAPGQAPATMGDGADLAWSPWRTGFDPHNELDRAVMATRRSAFPLHGLDPYFD